MRIERFKGALLSVLVIASIVTLAIQLLSTGPVQATLTAHPPILIVGNDNFTPANGVNGGGAGFWNNPYIIENWYISAENAHGIWIENTTAYFIVRNCYVHDGRSKSKDGILFENVINGIIDNNIVENNSNGIHLVISENSLVSNNIVENNYPIGIYIARSVNNSISNNIVENNYDGIDLYWYSKNNLVSNNIVENSFFGILSTSYCEKNLVSGNILENNRNGIYFTYSDNSTISGNIVRNNLVDGIYIRDYSDNNQISGNIVENSAYYGIVFRWYSYNNLIYHNNIINNATQASEDNTNYWDNGYPSGGNFWSDYTGADNYHGENQNIAGGEGIGDTSYNISGGSNQDRYPLMNSFPCSIENYFDINLLAGWDLVGYVTENTPNNIFTGLTYYADYILYYWGAPGGPYQLQDPDTACKDNLGYWVNINQNRTVGTSGTRPVSENIHLKKGWNLVSFPITDNTTTPNKIFAPLNYFENYVIYYWKAPGGPYSLQDPGSVLKDNLGYWVWIDQDRTVTVP